MVGLFVAIIVPVPLSDEDRIFQSTILRFARERIAPHVRSMDETAVFRKDLLGEMFELGLMGIEIPEEYGGQGGSFFQSVLAVEALATVDPSAAVIVDVQNTIANNILLRCGTETQKNRHLPRLAANAVASSSSILKRFGSLTPSKERCCCWPRSVEVRPTKRRGWESIRSGDATFSTSTRPVRLRGTEK